MSVFPKAQDNVRKMSCFVHNPEIFDLLSQISKETKNTQVQLAW